MADSEFITRTAPSIVAIIPLYNGARHIAEALESVLYQIHLPDEILVINDGSTDNGPWVVEQIALLHPLIKLLSFSLPGENRGQSAGRNYGVSQSSAALIALLDQDDKWYPRIDLTSLAKS